MAAGGLGQTDIVGSSAGREPFGGELTSDRHDQPGPERAQLARALGDEDGKQGAGVGQQYALAAVRP